MNLISVFIIGLVFVTPVWGESCDSRFEEMATPEVASGGSKVGHVLARMKKCSVMLQLHFDDGGDLQSVTGESSQEICTIFIEPSIEAIRRSILAEARSGSCEQTFIYKIE